MIISKTNLTTIPDYYSQILTGWCMKLNFNKNKEMFDFSNYSVKPKY